jgi:hypothetical protein
MICDNIIKDPRRAIASGIGVLKIFSSGGY